ncbi:hypothetical protein [Microbulbifer pacificus]|uniref:Uncharacterized protein n=1 Tax=Microbulbifer pacificus TaxID=407164 RepID=A0AAU0MYF8_9GAMM|nr:hypothetical protein [Microbulbifer pacificus]WOX05051.1 hypothetical protein R5R33_15080 [Microbulbifer pacificus]
MRLGEKYTPLVKTATVTAVLISAGMLVLMPVLLILKGANFSMWVSAYGKVISISFVLGALAIFMAWLRCELISSSLPRFLAAVIFGILSPVLFVIFLGIATYFQDGVFLKEDMSNEGLKNIGLIFGLLGPLCFVMYFGGAKNA